MSLFASLHLLFYGQFLHSEKTDSVHGFFISSAFLDQKLNP